jgi:NADH-quinone oxidoreductase subunit C
MSGDLLYDCPADFGPAKQQRIYVERGNYLDTCRKICADGFHVLSDLTAVDYLEFDDRNLIEGIEKKRFEIIVNVLSHAKKKRLRIRVQVPEEDPTIDSLCDIYPGAENLEREVFDMFGIIFNNHPDMSRILMPDDWEGHPLRKDYPIGRVPVQFKEVPSGR